MLAASILLVDDEGANLRVLERILARAGYSEVSATSDPREVEPLFRELQPDLVVLDLHMPKMDGFEIMKRLGGLIPEGSFLPILVLTGDPNLEVRQRALAVGARDFVNKPFDVVEVLLRIRNLLETRMLHRELRHQNEDLEERVRARTLELSAAQDEIIDRLVAAAEYRDDVTGRHAHRVGVLSSLLAREVGMQPEDVSLIARAATLHDVGKIGISDSILMKPGSLTPDEVTLMREHVQIGARILEGSAFPLLQMAARIALTHHERWDGTGYLGMTGLKIPLVGRIVALADAFDSMTHTRPYKVAAPVDQALEWVKTDSGSHFDPRVADALLEIVARDGLASWRAFREDQGMAPPELKMG
ncbi:MAG: HD domain-containing phosphohydrolase [Gemmatimonadota bacterium]